MKTRHHASSQSQLGRSGSLDSVDIPSIAGAPSPSGRLSDFSRRESAAESHAFSERAERAVDAAGFPSSAILGEDAVGVASAASRARDSRDVSERDRSAMPLEGLSAKEVRRLRRVDLLEMLVEQGRELERTRAELAEARALLEDRHIAVSRCGSIAEAALKLNEVFEAAQAAADQYVANVRRVADARVADASGAEVRTAEVRAAQASSAEVRTADAAEARTVGVSHAMDARVAQASGAVGAGAAASMAASRTQTRDSQRAAHNLPRDAG